MPVGLGGSVLERAGDVGREEGCFVETAFGALCDESGRGGGGMGEDRGKGELVFFDNRGGGGS